MKILIFFICCSLLASCTSHSSYDSKNGSNNMVVYKNSFVTVQRSTEVLGDDLMISHLVDKVNEFKNEDFSILDISDSIKDIEEQDSMSFYESCSFKKSMYKSFDAIPLSLRNLQNSSNYQLIRYYNFKDISPKKIILKTNIKFSLNQIINTASITDTLIRNTAHNFPQP